MKATSGCALRSIAIAAGLCAAGAVHAASDQQFRTFAREMADENGLDRARVLKILESSHHQQDIIDAISSPAESLPWYRYRPIFLKEARIRDGVRFWNENEALLERARREYGVPPEIIVAIIGVESRYGRHKGRHRVVDALRTLAFDYPPRSSFFRSELKEYLLLANEESFDVLDHTGSYAGAMGMPQFISSSYRAYAVDFNGNGRRDLWDETADAIGSVANYFSRHGWQPGQPVAARASVSGGKWRGQVSGNLKPNTTVGKLRKAGVEPQVDYRPDAEANLIVLEGDDGNEYWVGRRNFYVITRYNHSALYAMAVLQLSEAIQEQRENAR